MYSHFYSLHFFFFFSCYADHRDLHSFPTRRSSDLARGAPDLVRRQLARSGTHHDDVADVQRASQSQGLVRESRELARRPVRSEEHTSELQSLTNLVCRLLLEKKKKKTTNNKNNNQN